MPESGSATAWRKRAGFLFLWVLLPLPFLYIILPPFWILAGLVALWRIVDPERRWAPSAAMLNVLAAVILLLVLSAGGLRIGPLRPLGHLLILLSTLKMAQVDGKKDFRRILAPLFMVQLIGLVSAVHISVLPYLVLSIVWWWQIGMRVLLGRISDELRSQGLSGFREDGRSCWQLKYIIPAAGLAMFFAVPVFLLFPRLNSPFLALEGEGRESGFSTRVELDKSGSISESPEPVMRVETVDGRPVKENWLRLRATAYDQLFSGIWRVPVTDMIRAEKENGLIRLDSEDDLSGAVELKITPLRSEKYLFLPPGTVAVRTPENIFIDERGGLRRIQGSSSEPYRIYLHEPPPPRNLSGPGPADLLVSGPSRRMKRLAHDLKAQGRSAEERAFAVENELNRRCRYSLSFQGVSRGKPMDWFLFEGRRGHCEFFAAAMVELLRLQKVPARFVAGYHGGSFEDLASRVTVRASNAHAWVEVWLGPKQGWRVFDPTPPEGVDRLEELGWWRRLTNSWTKLEDFYNRNILSFGMREQFQILKLGGEWAGELKTRFGNLPAWPLALLLLVLIAFGLLRHRRGSPQKSWGLARRRLYRLELRMKNEGVELDSNLSWRQIGLLAAGRWPQAAEEILDLSELAEEEAYGPDGLNPTPQVEHIWKKIRSKISRADV